MKIFHPASVTRKGDVLSITLLRRERFSQSFSEDVVDFVSAQRKIKEMMAL